jgi:transposase
MIKITFTEAEIAELFYAKEHHAQRKVRKKMSVLYLKSQGLAHQEIKQLERICEATLVTYLTEYQQAGGIEALKKVCQYPARSDLEAHKDLLSAHFRAHPPATSKEAAAMVEELTGLKRSPNRVRIFMQKLGMNIRRVSAIPAKADVAAQEKFLTEELEPRIQQARAGKRALFLSMPPILC